MCATLPYRPRCLGAHAVPPAQAALHAAVQDALAQASGAPNLAEVVWAAVRRRGSAFAADRVVAYRLICALGRRQWVANEVCAHAALLDSLLDARGESGHHACTWRHAAVCALAATFDAPVAGAAHADDAAAALARRLGAAVSRGPFGAAGRDEIVPQVATL